MLGQHGDRDTGSYTNDKIHRQPNPNEVHEPVIGGAVDYGIRLVTDGRRETCAGREHDREH